MAIDKNVVIKEAQKFAAKGQFDKAIAEWKKLAKDSPKDANVFNTIGDLCLKKNSKPEAVDAYRKAADILAADGFTSKAIALYKKVLNIDPKKIEVHLALADLNAEKGLTGNALESYKLVADYYSRNKETVKALGIYQKMSDLNASNVAFRLKLADMYAKEGMKQDAVKAYLQAANVHIVKEAYNDARQLFEKALALDPNNKDVYHKAGLVYFKEGKFAEACKALKPSFESDQSNEEIADLYLDALSKAGRGAEAGDVYKKLLSRQPDRTDLREKLYRLCLDQKSFDEAFSEASSLANLKIENRDFDAAEELLREFTARAPRHVDGKRALSALYKTVGKMSEAAAELVGAARLMIENGDREGAKDILFKAIELSPENADAIQLLETLQPKPETSEPKPAVEKPQSPPPQPTADPSGTGAPALDEDSALAEGLAEADVLIKYGLGTKAVEQLERLAQTNPKNLQIRIKLRDLYGDQGNMEKAAANTRILADLYAENGMREQAKNVLREALEINSNSAEVNAKTGTSPALEEIRLEEPVQDQVFEETPLSFDQPAEMTPFDMTPQETVFPAAPEQPVSEEIFFDQPFTAPEIYEEKPLSAGQNGGLEQPEAEQFTDDAASTVPGQQATVSSEQADISEIWAEAEFYYQQGLFEEALRHYEKILEREPENDQARSRIGEISREQEDIQEFSKLAEAVDGLERFSGAEEPSAELATSASDEEAVRLLMQEIAQLKQKSASPAAAGTESREPLHGRTKTAASAARPEEDFFDLGAELNQAGNILSRGNSEKQAAGSDDFFDLASELRDELSTIAVPGASAEEQSLDDIFEEFKKGVEQQAIKEDSDIHYNLGIAYKEMGLLDDAIGEFVMTPEDEPMYAQSRYMLGLCYMEKGDYQNAISEIQIAVMASQSMGRDSGEQTGMRYDLGLAYQGAGNSDSALNEFQNVYEADPGYRDVGDKIKELRQGDVISLEQLKDDIEKEISSKFLAEGERIEREEKTKKSERVRS